MSQTRSSRKSRSPSSRSMEENEKISKTVTVKPQGLAIYGSLSEPWDKFKKRLKGLTLGKVIPGKGGAKRRRTKKRKSKKRKTYKKKNYSANS
jgi:hypothetical protein